MGPAPPPRGRVFGVRLALASLAALAVGIGLGVAGVNVPALQTAATFVEPFGRLWLRALQMTVIPLVVTQLLQALIRPDGARVGGLGARALALFVAYLVAGGALAVAATPWLLRLAPPGSLEAAQGGGADASGAAGVADAGAPPPGFGEWLTGLIPSNPFAAAAAGELMPLLVAVVLFGLAASRLDEGPRTLLAGLVRATADAIMLLVGWVLRFTPIGVLALVWSLTLDAGAGMLGVIGSYVVLVCLLLVGTTLLVYPLVAGTTGTPLTRFARAALPAQLVAASTQSSLASLPALVEGGERHLELGDRATGFVLPLCVATFKPNQAVYHGFNLVFLAHVFQVELAPVAVLTFMAFVILMSFSVAGVPRGGGGFRMLPFYLAVGIPIEGVVLFEAVKTIPDVFMTVYNVTADLSVATILERPTPEPS